MTLIKRRDRTRRGAARLARKDNPMGTYLRWLRSAEGRAARFARRPVTLAGLTFYAAAAPPVA